MSRPVVAELVQRCASTSNRREQSDLTNEISEAIYGEELSLRVLAPLFELKSLENWQSLTMILEEHSYRSGEAVDWLGELVESTAGEVRFRALLCIMELDPGVHPRLVARMLETLGERDLDAGKIAVVQYLAHVDLGRLGASLPYVSAPLAPALTRFVEEGRDFFQASYQLPPHGTPEELLAVASAARMDHPEAEKILADLASQASDPARAAAAALLRRR